MFEARPKEPTIRISFGLVTTGGSTNLVIASRMIERHNAIKKTALKKAPRISALNHYVMSARPIAKAEEGELTPKEYLSLLDFCAALTAQRPTAKEIMSFNYAPVSIRPMRLPNVGTVILLYTMWKASAINASDPTVTPTPSSRMKKAVSITSMMIMRVDFDNPIVAVVVSLRSGSSQGRFLNEVPVRQ